MTKLFDQVAAGCEPVRVNLPGGALHLAGAGGFAESVRAAPVRYVLRDEVRDACREGAAGWLDGPATPPRSLFVPTGAMWIEWSERDEAGQSLRAGVLLDGEADGRSGTLRAFREDASLGAELAQAHLLFDLDHREPPEREEDAEEICLVAPYATLVFDSDWREYFARAGAPRYVRAAALRRCAEQILPHFALAMGLVQLLNARRDLAEKRVDRAALDPARLRKPGATRLDHVELSLGRKSAADPGAALRRGRVRAPIPPLGLDRLRSRLGQARA